MSVHNSVTNPELLKALSQLKQEKITDSAFIHALYEAKFLCPGQMDQDSVSSSRVEKKPINQDMSISLSSLNTVSGEKYLMAFTDWEELHKWQKVEGQQTLIFSIKDYIAIILDGDIYAGVAINPFHENLVFDRNKLGLIYSMQNVIGKNESIMIGEPADYPRDMIDGLTKFFQATKSVKEAYLLWMARGIETSYLLVVDSTASPQSLFPIIGEKCKPYLNGHLLDMAPLESDLGKEAVRDKIPFYKLSSGA